MDRVWIIYYYNHDTSSGADHFNIWGGPDPTEPAFSHGVPVSEPDGVFFTDEDKADAVCRELNGPTGNKYGVQELKSHNSILCWDE